MGLFSIKITSSGTLETQSLSVPSLFAAEHKALISDVAVEQASWPWPLVRQGKEKQLPCTNISFRLSISQREEKSTQQNTHSLQFRCVKTRNCVSVLVRVSSATRKISPPPPHPPILTCSKRFLETCQSLRHGGDQKSQAWNWILDAETLISKTSRRAVNVIALGFTPWKGTHYLPSAELQS